MTLNEKKQNYKNSNRVWYKDVKYIYWVKKRLVWVFRIDENEAMAMKQV